jgi:hypothetical protein
MADDEIVVLGIATSSTSGALTVHRVVVRAEGDKVSVEQLEPWKGTPNDEIRSIGDLVDALSNNLDRKRNAAPMALALKRTESTRGRPTKQYDQKIRAEGAAMIAASSQGRRYFQYRTNQLGPAEALASVASSHGGYPTAKEAREAVTAACAALAELQREN